MRLRKNKQGYTVIEVMLFMAISGFMFIVASVAISGKQVKAEFKQGTEATNSELRQVINDVSNGYFPPNSSITCNSSGAIIASSNVSQGTSKGCMLVGKVIAFSAGSYSVHNIIGRQFTDSSDISSIPTSLAMATPVIASSTFTPENYDKGLRFYRGLSRTATATNQVRSLVFIRSFVTGSSGGSQEVVVVPSSSSSPTVALNQAVSLDNSNNLPTSNNVTLCFSDGGDQRSSIKVGGDKSQRTTTKVKIANDWTSMGC